MYYNRGIPRETIILNITKKLIIVDNSKYGEYLHKIAGLNDNVEVMGLVPSNNDFRKLLNNHIDAVIATDDLYGNDTVQDIVRTLQDFKQIPIYFVLSKEESANYLNKLGLPYVFTRDYNPIDVFDLVLDVFASEMQQTAQPAHTKETEIPDFLENKSVVKQPMNNAFGRSKIASPTGIIKNKLVTFCSPKGGVGKSTIALETAATLAAYAKEIQIGQVQSYQLEVCLVDLNYSYGSIASILECVRTHSAPPSLSDWVIRIEQKILDSLSAQEKLELQSTTSPNYYKYLSNVPRENLRFSRDEAMQLLVKDDETGLYILPTVAISNDLSRIKPEYVQIILQELKAIFDTVIVDTGNNFTHFTSTALTLADDVFVVAAPTTVVTVLIDRLRKDMALQNIDTSKLKMVINLANPGVKLLEEESLTSLLDIPIIAEIPYERDLCEVHENCEFYALHHKKSPFTKNLLVLANYILPIWNIQSNRKKTKRGLFR